MGLEFEYLSDQTPLDEDEKEGLFIKSIIDRSELDEFEQQNIETAIEWTLRRKFSQEELLSEQFIKELHKKMFGEVWTWAGEFRKTDKNIGVNNLQIGVELKKLIDDCKYWIGQKVYSEEEIAIRFKHRLVSIHCFANGNGRHSRLMADLMMKHIFGKKYFSWSALSLVKVGEARTAYLKGLKEADKGNFEHLNFFARS